MELESCDFFNIFLKFWLFEPHFLINIFSYKKKRVVKEFNLIQKN